MHDFRIRDRKDELDARASERLSARLHQARHLRGMTLKALAHAAGCSASLLSKIENGKASPSLPMLNRLVQVLDMSMGWMFDDRDSREPIIFRAVQRPAMEIAGSDRSLTVERVMREARRRALHCIICYVEVGGWSGADNQHPGEGAGHVLEGQLELMIGDRPHRLNAGDAFAFRSDQPHSFRNTGPTRASIFWVNTPPVA